MKIGTGVHSRTQHGKISDAACIDGLTRPSETDRSSRSSCLNAGGTKMLGEAPRERNPMVESGLERRAWWCCRGFDMTRPEDNMSSRLLGSAPAPLGSARAKVC
jgi:hypothetical protein